MDRHELPAPRILINGEELTGVTLRAGRLGGYDLTIATTVGPLALDVQSTALSAPGTDTAVSHLVTAPGLHVVRVELADADSLSNVLGRSRQLLEHFAVVQRALEELTDAEVSVEVSDQALGLALYA